MVDSLGSSARRSAWRRSTVSASETDEDGRRSRIGPNTRVVTDDGRDVVSGLRRDGPGRRCAATRRSATTRTREVGGHVPGHRRRALLDPRRLRHGRRRRHRAPARPRQRVHQHRRREGVPGGGRGGPQAAPDGAPTRPWSACPTSASARRSPRSSSRTRAQHVDEAALIAHVKAQPRRLQGAQAGHRGRRSIGRAANGKLDYKGVRESHRRRSAAFVARRRRPPVPSRSPWQISGSTARWRSSRAPAAGSAASTRSSLAKRGALRRRQRPRRRRRRLGQLGGPGPDRRRRDQGGRRRRRRRHQLGRHARGRRGDRADGHRRLRPRRHRHQQRRHPARQDVPQHDAGPARSGARRPPARAPSTSPSRRGCTCASSSTAG